MDLIDPNTVGALAGSALGLKVFGPVADEVGNRLQRLAAPRAARVADVASNASSKIGPDAPEGAPSIRVIEKILDEAELADNDVLVEYLGGVLATSRASRGRDDRAASYASAIGRMSTYELRAHYSLYGSARGHLMSVAADYDEAFTACNLPLFISWGDLGQNLDLTELEAAESQAIFGHVLNGLAREDLIRVIRHGDRTFLRSRGSKLDVPYWGGVLFGLTSTGIALFLAAQGDKVRTSIWDRFLDPGLTLPAFPGVSPVGVGREIGLMLSPDEPYSESAPAGYSDEA